MKVLLIDDHEIVRKGLRMMIEMEEEFEDIDEASNMEEGLNKLVIYQPDITILDVNLNRENGLDLVTQSRERGIQTKFVVFTSSSRKGDFERAKELEVDGYILKDSGIEDILYALKAIARGRKYYDGKMSEITPTSNREKILEILTDREKEIFIEVGKGLSNQEIGEKLYISENTVKKHLTSLMSKLGVKRRTEVALYATNFWRRKDDV